MKPLASHNPADFRSRSEEEVSKAYEPNLGRLHSQASNDPTDFPSIAAIDLSLRSAYQSQGLISLP